MHVRYSFFITKLLVFNTKNPNTAPYFKFDCKLHTNPISFFIKIYVLAQTGYVAHHLQDSNKVHNLVNFRFDFVEIWDKVVCRFIF